MLRYKLQCNAVTINDKSCVISLKQAVCCDKLLMPEATSWHWTTRLTPMRTTLFTHYLSIIGYWSYTLKTTETQINWNWFDEAKNITLKQNSETHLQTHDCNTRHSHIFTVTSYSIKLFIYVNWNIQTSQNLQKKNDLQRLNYFPNLFISHAVTDVHTLQKNIPLTDAMKQSNERKP